jgi:hypothetical protein
VSTLDRIDLSLIKNFGFKVISSLCLFLFVQDFVHFAAESLNKV